LALFDRSRERHLSCDVAPQDALKRLVNGNDSHRNKEITALTLDAFVFAGCLREFDYFLKHFAEIFGSDKCGV